MAYPYDQSLRPACPTAPVRLTNPFTRRYEQESGVLDTGASVTVIPQSLADKLRLVQKGFGSVVAAGGARTEVFVYEVQCDVAGVALGTQVVYALNVPRLLFGRDILNRFDVTLRGKAQLLEMVQAADG